MYSTHSPVFKGDLGIDEKVYSGKEEEEEEAAEHGGGEGGKFSDQISEEDDDDFTGNLLFRLPQQPSTPVGKTASEPG